MGKKAKAGIAILAAGTIFAYTITTDLGGIRGSVDRVINNLEQVIEKPLTSITERLSGPHYGSVNYEGKDYLVFDDGGVYRFEKTTVRCNLLTTMGEHLDRILSSKYEWVLVDATRDFNVEKKLYRGRSEKNGKAMYNDGCLTEGQPFFVPAEVSDMNLKSSVFKYYKEQKGK